MPNPVIILGCRLVNGRPGQALTRRLERALPLALDGRRVVVTGKHEAPAMADWLIRRGVAPERILIDNEATSTNENLENTRALLGSCTGWDIVTSDFHALRVKMWAKHHGYTVRVVTAPTPPARRAFLWSREIPAFAHSAARVVWRTVATRIPCIIRRRR